VLTPAVQILEVHALVGAVQQVVHARALDIAQRLALLQLLWVQPLFDHRNSC
jgi:hypothetical protein